MALAEGMRYCNCEWIVRMDSDDIAFQTDVKTNYICSTASGNRCIKWNGGGI